MPGPTGRLATWWSRRWAKHVDGVSRAVGGEHEHHEGDRGSVTGTGVTGEFVGRVAGDDLGHAEPSGAERRREQGPPRRHPVPPRGRRVPT